MAPSKPWTSKASVQTQVWWGEVGELEVLGRWFLLGKASQPSPSPPAKDLVAQNIDVILNRRSCMAATLRIIEENIPEVRL